jgi:hypothetical protein
MYDALARAPGLRGRDMAAGFEARYQTASLCPDPGGTNLPADLLNDGAPLWNDDGSEKYSGAHTPDSHVRSPEGIPSRTPMSGIFH